MRIPSREKFPDHIKDEVIELASENMISIFTSVYPELSDSLARCIKEKQKPAYYPEGAIIVDYGETCDHILFSWSGLICSSFMIGGDEKKTWYHPPGNAIMAVESWYTQGPNEEKLTARKETICMALSRADMEDIFRNYVEFNIPVRRLTELYLRTSLKRTLLIHYDPLSKYKFFIKNYWPIVKELIYREVAEMLGLARETLSRLRNKKW